MEIEVTRKEMVTVDRIRAECGVRYWEDADVNGETDEDGTLIPRRSGDCWNPTIILSTGQIMDWPKGTTAKVHYKVCDDGRYYLLTPCGEVAMETDGYVPKVMCPGGSGCGDYVIMSINADGFIDDWNPDLSDFQVES